MPKDDRQKLHEVTESYLDDLLERNPQVATVLGEHSYDGDVPSGSRESVLEEIEAAENLKRELDDFDSVEAELVKEAVEYDLYMLDDLRLWNRNPEAADAVISFIYPLYTRDFTDLGDRLESIAERLEKCPGYIEGVQSLIGEPVEIYVENEIEACNQLPGFLQLIADTAGKMERQDVAYRINDAAEETLDALEEYTEWLQSLEFETEWRLGEDRYSELLDKRKLPGVEEVRNLARREIDEAEKSMMDALDEFEGDNPREALESIEESTFDNFDAVLDRYVEEITEAREYTASEVVELPEKDGVEVIETPEHLAKLIPVDAYLKPTPLNQETPMFVVTADTRSLPEHNPPEIKGKAVGGFYPGHHLQQIYSCRNTTPHKLLMERFNDFGDDFTGGWRLHSQQIAIENGFGGRELRIESAKSRLRAAARALVEIDLHTDRITVKQAVNYLVDNAGLTETEASNEVMVYTENPGQQVSAVTGYSQLQQLRKDWSGNDRELHTQLLQQGGIPVKLHRKLLEENNG